MSGEAFLNAYKAPSAAYPEDGHLHTPPDEYDFNFMFPVKTLRSDRVELRPFVPCLHGHLLWKGYQEAPEILRWLGAGPWKSLDDVLRTFETTLRSQPNCLPYAVFTGPVDSKAPPVDPADYEFAGTLSLINSSVANLTSEPGWIIVLKKFHRTHVLTHAAGLAMHRILDMPDQGGLGLRRCQWYTTTLNEASQRAALRLGFKHEGILRALVVLPPGKEGVRPGRRGDAFEDRQTRDNWLASVIWEEWEGGVKEHVDQLMARKSAASFT